MGAALTLLFLLAGSVFIVRVASVFLRLTGLPDNVARFQSISALTGAGFTTTESETIVNYPARRRVIVALMLLGNLGLVSVVSTFIVALANNSDNQSELLQQVGLLVVAAALIGVFMVNKTFDRILCGLIEWILRRTVRHGTLPYVILLELPGGDVVAKHPRPDDGQSRPFPMPDEVEDLGLRLLGSDDTDLAKADSLICSGSRDAHDKLMARLLTDLPD